MLEYNNLVQKKITKWLGLRLLITTLILIYKAALDVTFVYLIVPVFSYAGFVLSLNTFKVIESYGLAMLVSFIIQERISKPSKLYLILLILLIIIPMYTLYGLQDTSRSYTYTVTLGLALIHSIVMLKLPIWSSNLRLRSLAILGSSTTIIFVLGWLIYNDGFSSFNLNFSRVYEYRRTSAETLYAGIFGYLNNWTFKVFTPVLLSIALWKKKYVTACALIVLQIIFFGLSSHKSVLLLPLLTIGFYWLAVKRQLRGSLIVACVVTLLIISGLLSYYADGGFLIRSVVLRRALFVPAFLNYTYFDFFTHNPKIYLSNGIFSFLSSYPYNIATSNLIGSYLGNEDMAANTGFIATGYMHFGYTGIFIFSALVGFLLKVIDGLSVNRLPIWLTLGITASPMLSMLTSSDLPTSLLTHGVLVSILVIWLLGSDKDDTDGYNCTSNNGS